jgi:hypothetical protein
MNQNKHINLFAFLFAVFILASCGITSHPNEKIVIGKWRPVTVEKIVDSSALQAAASMAGNSDKKQSKDGRPAGDGGASRKEAAFDRLVQSEQRATLEIFANKTAVKNYPGKPMNVTWKMKKKGTKIIARNVDNKMKFVLEVLEINKEQIVILEHAQVGDIKITYTREF